MGEEQPITEWEAGYRYIGFLGSGTFQGRDFQGGDWWGFKS